MLWAWGSSTKLKGLQVLAGLRIRGLGLRLADLGVGITVHGLGVVVELKIW